MENLVKNSSFFRFLESFLFFLLSFRFVSFLTFLLWNLDIKKVLVLAPPIDTKQHKNERFAYKKAYHLIFSLKLDKISARHNEKTLWIPFATVCVEMNIEHCIWIFGKKTNVVPSISLSRIQLLLKHKRMPTNSFKGQQKIWKNNQNIYYE